MGRPESSSTWLVLLRRGITGSQGGRIHLFAEEPATQERFQSADGVANFIVSSLISEAYLCTGGKSPGKVAKFRANLVDRSLLWSCVRITISSVVVSVDLWSLRG